MSDTFDAYAFLMHLARRWRLCATACAVSGGMALIVSLLLPAKYTATARILIEPPGSSDPRAATAVSPVYLESLRTYEHFALSDSNAPSMSSGLPGIAADLRALRAERQPFRTRRQ